MIHTDEMCPYCGAPRFGIHKETCPVLSEGEAREAQGLGSNPLPLLSKEAQKDLHERLLRATPEQALHRQMESMAMAEAARLPAPWINRYHINTTDSGQLQLVFLEQNSSAGMVMARASVTLSPMMVGNLINDLAKSVQLVSPRPAGEKSN